jgi:predicted O-methyltransferase YrrM
MEGLYHPALTAYLENLVERPHPVLLEMEQRAAETNFPIVGPLVGQLFYWLTRLTGARHVFELGSGFGYSTAWFALAVRDNGGGVVHHTVWDADLSQQAQHYLARMGLSDLMTYHVGEAVETLQRVGGEYDIIFCDIDKQGYPASLPVVKRHLRVGGLALYDNMFWSGRVWDAQDTSEATEAIRTLTQAVTRDPDLQTLLVPMRDGVLAAIKLRE